MPGGAPSQNWCALITDFSPTSVVVLERLNLAIENAGTYTIWTGSNLSECHNSPLYNSNLTGLVAIF